MRLRRRKKNNIPINAITKAATPITAPAIAPPLTLLFDFDALSSPVAAADLDASAAAEAALASVVVVFDAEDVVFVSLVVVEDEEDVFVDEVVDGFVMGAKVIPLYTSCRNRSFG